MNSFAFNASPFFFPLFQVLPRFLPINSFANSTSPFFPFSAFRYDKFFLPRQFIRYSCLLFFFPSPLSGIASFIFSSLQFLYYWCFTFNFSLLVFLVQCTRLPQTLGWFCFQSTDHSTWLVMSSNGTIDLLLCTRWVFDPEIRSIANRSRQSISGRMRLHN